MKFLFYICITFFISQFVFSQTMDNPRIMEDVSALKKPLLLTTGKFNLKTGSNGVIEQWSNLSSGKDKTGISYSLPEDSYTPVFSYSSMQSILYSSTTPQTEDSKMGNEIFYFLGAVGLAAVIYFLVPDNEPASKPVYTFGFPVTPK